MEWPVDAVLQWPGAMPMFTSATMEPTGHCGRSQRDTRHSALQMAI